MTNTIKKQYAPEFKTKVVLELLKEDKMLTEICSQYAIHPTQARRWKELAVEVLKNAFTQKQEKQDKEKNELIQELYKQIGQAKVEMDWLKKKMGFSPG